MKDISYILIQTVWIWRLIKLSNNGKKQDNDNIRSVQSTLNELNRVVKEKNRAIDITPNVGLIEKYKNQNAIDVLEAEEQFSNLCEQVAALQFSGNKKDKICDALEIDSKVYKEIVISQEFIDVKRRIAEDEKVNILTKILGQVDSAIIALSELLETADEDRVRMNSAALVLEHASRLLEEQKSQYPNISNVIKDAASGAEPVTVTLAQIIMKQRDERGLSK